MKEYKRGDEINILKLHQDVFDSNRSLKHWRWQFNDHVQGHGWITLSEFENEIVGQYCLMRNDLHLMGRRVIAGQSCDTMVRTDQRGKNLFSKLALANYEAASNKGVQAVFGFPNRNSYPGFMKYLDWHRIINLKRYSYRIGYKKIWGPIIDYVFKYILGMLNRLRYLARLKLMDDNLRITVSTCLPDDL